MKRLMFIAAVAGMLSGPASTLASQEGILAIGEVRVTSPGIGESGPIVVTATRGPEGFSALEVQAFGHATSLSQAQLEKLQGQFVNGLQLSYEAGYAESGGRTVYIVLSKGFTSGTQESQQVSVNEEGTVTVEPPIRRSAQ